MYNEDAERLGYIDAAKGMAIILVVFVHVYGLSDYSSDLVLLIIGSLHNPTFYIASGVLFPITAGHRKETAQIIFDKGMNLLVPYMVWCVLYRLYVKMVMENSYSCYDFNIWDTINKLWFLPVLFFAFGVVTAIAKLNVRYELSVLVFTVALLTSVFLSSMMAKITAYTFLVWIGSIFWQLGDRKRNVIVVISIIAWVSIVLVCFLPGRIVLEDGFGPGFGLLIILISYVAGGVSLLYFVNNFVEGGGGKTKTGS